MLDPGRTVAELRELQERTGNENGAQRVAWTETWQQACEWLSGKLAGTGAEETIDAAGNQWFTLAGYSERALLIGGHLDSVPNGGWLDGALNVMAGAEVLRRIAEEETPPVTVRLVNWADQAGSTPMDQRRDALAGAARLELELREIAARIGGGAVCTMGGVVTKPGIVTSVVETAECLLDQRHLDEIQLAEMLDNAKAASRRFAQEEDLEVEWERIWNIEPILFDDGLIELAEK